MEGEASARLLPFPSLTFTDVAVGGAGGAEPAMTVETFSMDAELAPFLRGEFLIFDMRLVRPKGVIAIDEAGVVDWSVRPSSPFDARQIVLERLTITEGQVTVRHAASGRDHLLSEINALVSARSLAGPWRFDGSMRVDGQRAALSVSTSAADEDGAIGLRVRTDVGVFPATVELDGSARLEEGRPVYAGRFSVNEKVVAGTPLRPSIDAEPAATMPDVPVANRLTGLFSIDHQRVSVDEFRFETGPVEAPYIADGKASLDIGADPRFDIEAKGAQVRMDEAAGPGEAVASVTLAQRLAVLEEALAALPRPTIPGAVRLDLPAIIAGDTTIRDVRLEAEPVEDGWAVRSLSAALPGRTTFEADGLLRTGEDFGFKGDLLLAVGQPSGFAAWLASDVDDAVRRLPAGGFNAKVELTARRQTFSDLELIFGSTRFRGEIDNALPPNARPTTRVRLEGGAVGVDGMSALASVFVSDEGVSRFAGRDLDLRLKAGPVSVEGFEAGSVDALLRLRGDRLDIDRFSVSGLAGASISATGRIENFPGSPRGDVDASIVSVDLAPLLQSGAARFPGQPWLAPLAARAAAYPGLFSDARLDLVASLSAPDGGASRIAGSLQGVAGGSELAVSLSGDGEPGALGEAPIAFSFKASNEDGAGLLALYGLPALPISLVGPATTTIEAKGALSAGLATDFAFSGEGLKLGFAGSVQSGASGPAAKGTLSLRADDLEPWLATLGVALPGMGMGTSATLAAEADYGSGLLVLTGVEGTLGDDAVGGDVNLELKGGRPHLTGALAVDAVDLVAAAAMVVGETAVAPGEEPWPTAPFAQEAALPFTADLDLSAGSLLAGPIASIYDADLTLRLAEDGMEISDLSGKLHGGEATGALEFKNNGGAGLFAGQLALKGADLALALPDAGLSGTLDLSSSLSASGKSLSGMAAALSGSGTAAIREFEIEGLNPQAFPAFLAEADAIGRDVDAARTAGFAPAIASAGTFDGGEAEIAFTIAGGVLRAPPVTLANPAATLTAELRADLNVNAVSVDGAITYVPGEDALVGSEPALRFSLNGPFGEAKLNFDTEPLAQFLTQRALEREQARVEALQASLLERQRLRREVRYYASLQDERERIEEEKRVREEEARLRVEAERAAAEQSEREAEAIRRQSEADAAEATRRERRAARRVARREAAENPPSPESDTDPAELRDLTPLTLDEELFTLPQSTQ